MPNVDGSMNEDEAIDAAEERLPPDALELFLRMLADDPDEIPYAEHIKSILRRRGQLPVELTKDERISALEAENGRLRTTLERVRREKDQIASATARQGAQINTQHAKIKLLTAELREAQVALAMATETEPPKEIEDASSE